MNTKIEQLQELISLTKCYLSQECATQERIIAAQENYQFFKQEAQEKRLTQPTVAIETIRAPKAVASPIRTSLKQENPIVTPTTKPLPEKVDIPPSLETKTMPAPLPKSLPQPFLLAPLSSQTPENFQDIRKILHEKFPHQVVLENPPSDQVAKNVQNRWKEAVRPSIIILSFNESAKEQLFLTYVAKALHVYFGSAGVIQGWNLKDEKDWEAVLFPEGLQLVLVTEMTMEKQYHLKQRLSSIPHYVLSNPQEYMKDPKLKPILWSTLHEICRSHS